MWVAAPGCSVSPVRAPLLSVVAPGGSAAPFFLRFPRCPGSLLLVAASLLLPVAPGVCGLVGCCPQQQATNKGGRANNSAPIGMCSIRSPLELKRTEILQGLQADMKGKMFSHDRFICGVRTLWLISHPRFVEKIGLKRGWNSL